MNKKIVAVVLIMLAGGAWLYLDHLNRQEQLEAEQTRAAMEKARAEARTRFESMLRSDLTICLAAAEKAAKKLADEKAACQLTYDTRMTHGW